MSILMTETNDDESDAASPASVGSAVQDGNRVASAPSETVVFNASLSAEEWASWLGYIEQRLSYCPS